MHDAFFAAGVPVAQPTLLGVVDAGIAGPVLGPVVIIGLCVLAGLSTWLLLPSRRDAAVRRIGGVILAATGLIFAALLFRWTVHLGGMSVYFWVFAITALCASVRVITHRKPVYSALYFVLTVFSTGGLFVLMWAEFMAAALVLIYAGAILITYVFVIMLASEAATGAVGSAADSGDKTPEQDGISRDPLLASLVGFAIAGVLVFLITDKLTHLPEQIPQPAITAVVPGVSAFNAESLGSAQSLGQELIEHQALNVQLAGVILTLAMVGAITLARRRVITPDSIQGSGRGIVETVTAPMTPTDDNPHSIPVYGTTNPRQKEYPEN
jgi:NADH-quinone oxidoreductase subunit J